MRDIELVWTRITRYAGEAIHTKPGLLLTYHVPGNYLHVNRTNRAVFKTNFRKALDAMPAEGPAAIKDRQGSVYTWASFDGPTHPRERLVTSPGRHRLRVPTAPASNLARRRS